MENKEQRAKTQGLALRYEPFEHLLHWTGLAFLAGLIFLFSAFPAFAESRTVSFFSVWEGEGAFYKTGEEMTTFVGAFEGPVYLETPEGPVEGGRLACPGKFEMNVRTAKQSGSGSCQFVSTDGSLIFTDWSCSGVHMVGCSGEMTIKGGSGRHEGASGAGPFTIRGTLRDAAISEGGGGVDAELRGIIFWKDFSYEVPN